MPKPDRPVVGPADPETRRKKLREVLDTPTKGDGVAPKTLKDAVDKGVEEGSDKPKKKGKVRRYGPKGETIEDLGG
jgi:hypothetical protein